MKNVAIVTTTFYRSLQELRFELACELVSEATIAGYPVFVVDGSPVPAFLKTFVKLGARVERQKEEGMGASRRQVFCMAREYFASLEPAGGQCITVWTEAEKSNLVRFVPRIVEPILSGEAKIVIPKRSKRSWESYPKFQQDSEQIANLIYHEVTGIDADPMFGPVAFDCSATDFFLHEFGQYGVLDNYVQHYAPLYALSQGFKIACPEIDFEYPAEQKEEEEGTNFKLMVEKRLWQLRQISETYLKLAKRFRLNT